MKICDICGKEPQNVYYPVELLQQYQTGGIKDVCDTCERWANAEKAKADYPTQLARRPIWRRLGSWRTE